MSDRPKSAPPPSGWEENLFRSKAQIAAGERVPLLPILDRCGHRLSGLKPSRAKRGMVSGSPPTVVIALTPQADAQVKALERFYIEAQHPQALCNLGHALAEASLIIMDAPGRGLPAPRPYPALASLGLS